MLLFIVAQAASGFSGCADDKGKKEPKNHTPWEELQGAGHPKNHLPQRVRHL